MHAQIFVPPPSDLTLPHVTDGLGGQTREWQQARKQPLQHVDRDGVPDQTKGTNAIAQTNGTKTGSSGRGIRGSGKSGSGIRGSGIRY